MTVSSQRVLLFLCAIAGAVFFVNFQQRLQTLPRMKANAELEVVLPLFAQVLMTGGDRYLAANLGAIRALVTETQRMTAADYALLGRLQDDVSWLNPAHEDNYYIAAAILPWEGQLNSAQTILSRATKARFFDYQPPFYYAFNLVHFKGDGLAAAQWLKEAAVKLPDPQERLILENFAARWAERSDDLRLAISVVDAMATNAKRQDFAKYLRMRSDRLRALLSLRMAADLFKQRHGRPIASLEELTAAQLLPKIPTDPLGAGFSIDAGGTPVFGSGVPR